MTTRLDIDEICSCTCLRARRAARRLTQVYDHALKPVGLTSNQFGLLGNLYGHRAGGGAGLSIKALAEQVGMDPTTLNRNLQPLIRAGRVADRADPRDGRVRLVAITDEGVASLRRAVPPWRRTQGRLRELLGADETARLNELLDRAVLSIADSA